MENGRESSVILGSIERPSDEAERTLNQCSVNLSILRPFPALLWLRMHRDPGSSILKICHLKSKKSNWVKTESELSKNWVRIARTWIPMLNLLIPASWNSSKSFIFILFDGLTSKVISMSFSVLVSFFNVSIILWKRSFF